MYQNHLPLAMDSSPSALHSGFTSAANLVLPKPLELPSLAQDLLGNLVCELEAGCVNMIESDQLKEVHTVLHHIMVAAVADDWEITLVDLANCFNPQKISSIAFEYDLHGQMVLQKIGLARPFQIHQAVSIIKELVRHVIGMQDRKHLVVLTDISSLFFDPSLANEDPDFPIPQLEMMRQSVGVLQSLAVQGYTVLITNANTRVKSLPTSDTLPNVKPASLKYSSKFHISITNTDAQRKIQMISHPYLPARTKLVRDLKSMVEIKQPSKQKSLSDFF